MLIVHALKFENQISISSRGDLSLFVCIKLDIVLDLLQMCENVNSFGRHSLTEECREPKNIKAFYAPITFGGHNLWICPCPDVRSL